MASSESGNQDTSGNEHQNRNSSMTQRTSMLQVRRQTRSPESVQPDTEEHVQSQTEDVFMNYVYQRFQNDSLSTNDMVSPALPELTNFTESPITPAAEIGRRLADLGDDINEKYADVFDNMISLLNIGSSEEEAYDAFSNIGRRVLGSGLSWSRILFLLQFGYRMAMTTLRQYASSFASFLSRIVSFVCKFFILEKINKWIADHGGWRAALNFIPRVSNNVFLLISGLAAISVLAVVAVHRYLR